MKNLINKFITGIMLMAMAGMLISASTVTAMENKDASKCACVCTSCTSDLHIGSSGNSANTPDAANRCDCGCTLSPAPESNEPPIVVPSHQHNIDSSAIALPEQIDLTSRLLKTLLITDDQPTYKYLCTSTPDGRGPPA